MPEEIKDNQDGQCDKKEGTRVLVIHDHKESSAALSDLLESININPENISVAANANEACNIIKSSRENINIILWKYDLGGTGLISTITEATEGKPYSLLITCNKVFQHEKGGDPEIYLDKEFIAKLQEHLAPSEPAKLFSEPTHILIVHSDPAIREGIKKMLLKHHVPTEKIHFADKPDGDGLEKAMESQIDTIKKGNEIIQRREQIALLFVENTKGGAVLAEQLVTDPTFHPYITVVAKGKKMDDSWCEHGWQIDKLEMAAEKSAHDLAADEETDDKEEKDVIAVIDEDMVRTLIHPENAESNEHIADSEQVNADIQKVIKNAKSHLVSKEHKLFIERSQAASQAAIEEVVDCLSEDDESDEIDEEEDGEDNGSLGIDDELLAKEDEEVQDFGDDTKTPAVEKNKGDVVKSLIITPGNGGVGKGSIITPGNCENFFCFYEEAKKLPTLVRYSDFEQRHMVLNKNSIHDENVGSFDVDGTLFNAFIMGRFAEFLARNNNFGSLIADYPKGKKDAKKEILERLIKIAQFIIKSEEEKAALKDVFARQLKNRVYEDLLDTLNNTYADLLSGLPVHSVCRLGHRFSEEDVEENDIPLAIPTVKMIQELGIMLSLFTGLPAEVIGGYRNKLGIRERCYPMELQIHGEGGQMVFGKHVRFSGGKAKDKSDVANSVVANGNRLLFHMGDQMPDTGVMAKAYLSLEQAWGSHGKGFFVLNLNSKEGHKLIDELYKAPTIGEMVSEDKLILIDKVKLKTGAALGKVAKEIREIFEIRDEQAGKEDPRDFDRMRIMADQFCVKRLSQLRRFYKK